MNRGKVTFAQWNMRKQLSLLWQCCFEDLPRPTDYFFDNKYETRNCLVYEIDNKVAAMVHLLPAQISQKKGLFQAHYIYAAATLPEYREKGYMSKLIRGAAIAGKNRGDKFSFILPASDKLYKYYGKFDYSTYFEMRFITLSKKELNNFAAGGHKNNVVLTSREIRLIRNADLLKQYGSIVWSTKAISYAMESNKLYGGRLISSKTGNKLSYALCRMGSEGICEVMEIVSDMGTIADLSANILHYMPARSYRFRLSNYSKLYGSLGKVLPYGMIKPLDDTAYYEMKQNSEAPYLGLTLD